VAVGRDLTVARHYRGQIRQEVAQAVIVRMAEEIRQHRAVLGTRARGRSRAGFVRRRLVDGLAFLDGLDDLQLVERPRVRRRVTAVPFPATATAFEPAASVAANASLIAARELSARRTPADLAAAIEAVERAIDIDPDLVAAWCALAELHVLRASLGLVPSAEAGEAAVLAAEKALALDRDSSPALAVRGWVRSVIRLDVAAGLADFERNLRIADGYWAARAQHAWALVAAGSLDRGVSEMRAASELNPWGVWHSGLLGLYLFFARRFDEALAHARNDARRYPGFDTAQMRLSIVASGMGLHDEAIAAGRLAMERAPDTPFMHTCLASALARAGRRDEALALVRQIEATPFPLPGAWLASAWLALGRRDRALDRLQQARRDGSPHLVYALVDPRLDALRGDRDFEQLKPGGGWSG